MDLAICPKCRSGVRRNWRSAFCDRCGVELKERGETRLLLASSTIIGFIIIMYIARQETKVVLENSPSNISGVLFFYYLKLLAAMWVLVGMAKYFIRHKLAKYEHPDSNT